MTKFGEMFCWDFARARQKLRRCLTAHGSRAQWWEFKRRWRQHIKSRPTHFFLVVQHRDRPTDSPCQRLTLARLISHEQRYVCTMTMMKWSSLNIKNLYWKNNRAYSKLKPKGQYHWRHKTQPSWFKLCEKTEKLKVLSFLFNCVLTSTTGPAGTLIEKKRAPRQHDLCALLHSNHQ